MRNIFVGGLLLFFVIAVSSQIVLGLTSSTSLSVSYVGSLGIPNIASPNDNISFTVRVNMPSSVDPSLDTGQVHFSFGGRSIPIPCAGVSPGVYECSFLFSLKNQRSNVGLSVILFKDGFIGDINSAHAVKQVTIFVDSSPPVVESVALSRKGSQINISFVALDGGGECATGNSGVKSVELRLGNPDGTIIDSIPGLDGICSLKSDILYAPTTQGNVRVCAVAEDFVGLKSAPKCSSLTFDDTPPVINDFNVVKTSDESRLQFIRSRSNTSAIIKGSVTGSDTQTVKIDVSKIVSQGTVIKIDAVPDSNNITAIRQAVQISPGAVNDCSFTVTAIDNSGNERSQTFTCGPLTVDSSGPVVSNLPPSGKFFKSVDSFTADFADASGVDIRTVKALIGSSEVPSPRCDESGGVTRCSWNNVNFPIGANSITIPRTVADIFGTPMDSSVSVNIEVVGGAPTISGSEQEFQDSGDNIIPSGELVRDGRVKFVFRVQGISSIPKANFSVIGIDNLVEANACVDDVDGFKNCTFMPTVAKDGPYFGNVQFIFSDRAGNTVTSEKNIAVSGVYSGSPDIWRVQKVSCTPAIIDRFSASIKEHPVRCKVELAPKISGGYTITTIRMHPEYASKCSNINIVDDSDIDVMNGATTTPFLRFSLSRSVINDQEKNISCPIQIFSVIQISGKNYFSTIPDEENVTMVLRFGGDDKENKFSKYYDKMDDAIDDAKRTRALIKDGRKFLAYAESICGFRQQLTSTKLVLETATDILGSIAEVVRPLDDGSLDKFYDFGACPSTDRFTRILDKIGIGGPLDTIAGYIDQACAIVTCKGSDEGLAWYYGGGTANLGGVGTALDAVRNSAQSLATLFSPEKDPAKKFETFGTDADIKNSVILSAVRLCIPGIIYNIDKYNQMQCEYARCLVEDVPRKNQPPRVCSMAKQMSTCSMVIGEAYSIFPLRWWDDLITKITKYYYAPGPVLTQQLVGRICSTACKEANTGPGWNAVRFSCASVSLWSESKKVAEEWKSKDNFKDWFSPADNSCDKLDEVKEKLDRLKS